ncbi:MAG TPA: choice-of-anchor Q domain-containing protein [Casimicrobiaceae bacterium]|nr:choice-of-anchor Q domain-containing protein [Casimicrobiaceae bacterium]
MNVRTVLARSAIKSESARPRRRIQAALTGALLAIALAALQLFPGAADAQLITEYSAGIPPAPSPRGIVLGPDGNIWFSEQTGDRIGRITPAGAVTEFSLSPGANPGGITVGPDNNIWFVERVGNAVGKIVAIPANGVVGTITVFPLPQPNSLPVSIVAGSDGNLWFLEFNGNRIGRITTTGTITEYTAGVSPNAGLSGIAAGPDGNLWFTEATANKIGRINPNTQAVVEFSAGITAGANLNGIVAGPDGNLWFTEINGNRVGKITIGGAVTEYNVTPGSGPRNIWTGPDNNLWFTETSGNRIGKVIALPANGTVGAVTEFSAGISPGAQPWSIATGSDNNLWFTELSGSTIGKITTAGAVTEFDPFVSGITIGAAPAGIAKGPDGNLWFAEYGIDAIGQITPAGVVTQFTTGITPGSGPAFIALGPDGNLWFTENTVARIGRITPAGVVTEFSAGLNPAANLQLITLGPDNNMWFAECDGNKIGRIIALPANGTVGTITEYPLPQANSCPTGIAAGPDGALWFTEYDGNRIGRITTAGVVTEYSTGITGFAGLNDITLGADNNLWFTEYDGNRIGKIIALPANGTVGTITEFSTGNTIYANPNLITSGPDGHLWFTADAGNHIGRISTAGVVTFYGQAPSPGSVPLGITAGPDGNMWFTELRGARIGRFLMPASNYVVTNNSDNAAAGSGSLRDAINRANSDPGPNTITFDPAVTGTITLTGGQIQISQALAITGPGAGTLAIDGNANNRIFSIFATDPACPALDGSDYLVSISGLRLTNARRSQSNAGGAIFTEHSLTLDGVSLDSNVAAQGGGLYTQVQYPGQTLTLTNTQWLNNKAQPIGPSATDSRGGAIAVFERCAGVHVAPVVTISGSTFSGNQALPATLGGFGGAIVMDSIGSLTITDTRIVNNQVVTPNPPVATQIYRSGGLHTHMKTLLIERSEISDNALVDPTGSDLTRGGGLVTYNTAADLQGAADTMSAKIVNSTISGNSSPATAGAMLISGNVAVEFDNSTVSSNLAPPTRTGGIILSFATGQLAPTLTTTSSIFANNAGDGGDVAAGAATFPTFTITSNNSLFEKICPSPSCEISLSGAGNLTGVDPALAPLAFNGGPTRTHALFSGSPAINAGSNPLALATDQRGAGFPRTSAGVTDMGAYETAILQPPLLVSAKSRKTHGSAGIFDLLLNSNPLTPSTETRNGPAHSIVFTFDKAVTAGSATVSESAAVAGAPTFNGVEMTVPLTGVVNPQYVTVNVGNVVAQDGGTGGVGTTRIGFLFGDANGSRQVTVADVGIVNSALLQALTNANFLYDVNVDGRLTVADKGLVNANLLKKLPTP